MALAEDDRVNLQVALKARDINPKIRVVLRQFNRTLARKIEQNLPNCSVLSLASHAAATIVGAALDQSCVLRVAVSRSRRRAVRLFASGRRRCSESPA